MGKIDVCVSRITMDHDSSSSTSVESEFSTELHSDILDSLPDHVNPLVPIFEERMKLENEFEKELWELRQKYDKKMEDSAERVKKIVSEINKLEEVGYWAQTMLNCHDIAEFISQEDESLLNYISDIRSITVGENNYCLSYPDFKTPGVIIEFEFSENPYITNKILFKYFKLSFDVKLKDAICGRGAPYCFDMIGCNINWKEGKNITIEKVVKTQRHKKTKKIRTVTKEVKRESFFRFFDHPEKKDGQFQFGILGQCPDLDYLLAEWISNVVVRRSLHFFIGLADNADFAELESSSDQLDGDEDDCLIYDGENILDGNSEDEEIANLSSHMKTFSMNGQHIGKNQVSNRRNHGNRKNNKRF